VTWYFLYGNRHKELKIMEFFTRLFGKSDDKEVLEPAGISDPHPELQTSAQSIAAATNQQSAAIHQSVASITQIRSMLSQTNLEVQKSLTLTEKATQQGETAKQSVELLQNAIQQIIDSKARLEELAQAFQQMELKTKAINDIALKTQICSFNASVEAARAGQYGKGFGIVADEVGRLAQITGKASKEIDELIKKSKSALQKATTAVYESVQQAETVNQTVSGSYLSLLENIQQVHISLDNVGKASTEQIQGVNQVAKALEQIESASHESRNIAENIYHYIRGKRNHEPDVLNLMDSIAQKSSDTPIEADIHLDNISADDPSFKARE
jgi:methyl-accepting chemotaxis protein